MKINVDKWKMFFKEDAISSSYDLGKTIAEINNFTLYYWSKFVHPSPKSEKPCFKSIKKI